RSLTAQKGATLALLALPPRVGPFTVSLDEDGFRERVFRDIYREYAQGHPSVRVLDLFDVLCPAGDCDRPPAGSAPGCRHCRRPRVGPFALSLDEDGFRERVFRDIYREYAQGHPSVRVLDLFDVICPAGDCDRPPAGFDPGWRYDGMHYTSDGARWVGAWLLD